MIPISNQIELRHLRYFLAVAENLHFRKAAEMLYISQPGLSRQISQMEEKLGLRLFERDNKNVRLTLAGEYLSSEIKMVLKNLDHLYKNAKLLNDGIEGNLRFGYVGSAMQRIIPDLLLEFRKYYPDIIFNLKEMDNQRQIESLLAHDIDIGFVRLERVPSGLTITPVFEETFSLVLPLSHPVNSVNFHDLKQLKDEHFIMFDPSYSSAYYEKVMQIFEFYNFHLLISHSTIHASVVFRFVENNFGVSIVPSSLQEGYNMKVKFIELSLIPYRTVLSAVWNLKNRNPLLNKFIELNNLG